MSHRLWFRPEEILPLAEHAMACRSHPFTGAQAAAVAPDGPALIVQHTTGSQVVRSNGFPIWYLLAWRAATDTRMPAGDRTRLSLTAARAWLRRHR
jgi:hypothetical protein